MAEESSTPLFTVGHENAAFLASCEILSKAWEESQLANDSESFSVKEHEGFVYVAFPSFHKIESFTVKGNAYGEGNIQTNNMVFSASLKGNDDEPALVHQGALKLFLDIMEKTDFQAQLQIYMDSKQRKRKPIIFVGHSLGGAVATLATLWLLEKRLRQSSPFCITFGCPLVGNEGLVEAVGRENWGGNFLHVISQNDIVPRMLLAPVESIAEPLTAILPYWHGKVVDSSIQDACRTLLESVLQSATVAYHGVDSKGSDGLIKRSPYKPFGTCMFCSNHGAACIENSETVLMMLHLTMLSHEKSSDNIVQDWFSEHIGYGSVLKHVIENSISGQRFAKPDSKSSYEMGISVQLKAIGFGAQNDHARFALRKAGEIEDSFLRNVDELAFKLSKQQRRMAEIEWYKELCENNGGIGYYDTFKNLDMKRDINVNLRREKLGGFWDDIIEMWENHKLPSYFQSQNKWINAGTAYRRLVEPLDIAHYYRMSKGKGNYLSDGRPNRYKVLQEWMEAKEKTRSSRGQRTRTKPASLTEDSCFWARVEEACKDLENLKQQGQHQSLQSLEEFEKYVTTMVEALSISSDVLLEGSRFMMWWEEWKKYNKNQSPDWSSPLPEIMENLSVSFEHSMTRSRALKTYESSSPSNILTIGGFTVGHENAAFLASCEILSKAWEESRLAEDSESFSVKEHEDFVYVAFPSFHKIESFTVEGNTYGEGNIQTNNEVFSDSLKGNDDKPALVHQGALKLFLDIMEETDFQAQLQIYMDSEQRKLKPIIFVGHSLGGAVATLATLWVLEKRLRQSSPFCITFGCPLVGNEGLVEAVGRENWGGNFLHVISQHDIVPRMLLAPVESIAEPLTAILPYWHAKVADVCIEDACRTLLESVLQYTATVAYYGVDSRGSDGVIKRSPYKPFGTFMFCSNHDAACIENSETVLMMLHWTMQSHEKLSDIIVQDWFSEHIGYGSVLKHVIENSISGKRFGNSDSKSSYEMGISVQLEAIGFEAQNDHAQLALRKAGQTEKRYNTNADRLAIELSLNQSLMAEIEWYKEGCEKNGGIGYYDTFKGLDKRDIDANLRRQRLGGFWDDIIEKWEGHELPSDFESQNKWINAGNAYRKLVEPLDIAYYYRNNSNGNYFSDGRHNRHKVLQKWMEAKEKARGSKGQRPRTKRTSLTPDSCLWARVEEAWKELENLKRGQHESLNRLEKFEEYVTKMENDLSISRDVFFQGSSFMMWWEEWKEYKKNQSPDWSSPLCQKMDTLQVI